jgi:hypothetical protein
MGEILTVENLPRWYLGQIITEPEMVFAEEGPPPVFHLIPPTPRGDFGV